MNDYEELIERLTEVASTLDGVDGVDPDIEELIAHVQALLDRARTKAQERS
jgi:hypothetical protein